MSTTFRERVLSVVRGIPRGQVMTYKEVAAAAGSAEAARSVGSIMRQNHLTDVPCHRVIRSDGRAGDYNRGGEQAKVELLKREGAWPSSITR